MKEIIVAFCLLVSVVANADYYTMTLEELMNIEVTSVTKSSRNKMELPAAIYVISQEDIARSYADSVPELLRQVPGLSVAIIDSNKWAVSARGFNSRTANKLLVLLDGKSLYSNTFSGVYWESLDIVLPDIARIEVIRGPGAALWGSNAVNGVINIITKNAQDTTGGLIAARGGSEDSYEGSWRYGGQLLDEYDYRIYAKHTRHGGGKQPDGASLNDDWVRTSMGVKLDTRVEQGHMFGFGANAYTGKIDQGLIDTLPDAQSYFTLVKDRVEHEGFDVQLNYARNIGDHKLSALTYVDFTSREELYQDEHWFIWNGEMQYDHSVSDTHTVSIGVGYRHKEHETNPIANLAFDPADQTYAQMHLFLQDELRFLDRYLLVTGIKLEHNEYTDEEIEAQPNIRLSYHINESNTVWGAVSRSVRTPSRVEKEGMLHMGTSPTGFPGMTTLPVIIFSEPSDDFESEELLSYELGYRSSLTDFLSIDAALFYNEYDHYRVFTLDPGTFNTVVGVPGFIDHATIMGQFDNAESTVRTHGAELSIDWRLSSAWALRGSYSYLSQSDLSSDDLFSELANHPSEHMVKAHLSGRLHDTVTMDLWGRYISELGESGIGTYTAFDARINWHASESLMLSLIGKNLIGGDHREFYSEVIYIPDTEVGASAHAQIVWEL